MDLLLAEAALGSGTAGQLLPSVASALSRVSPCLQGALGCIWRIRIVYLKVFVIGVAQDYYVA